MAKKKVLYNAGATAGMKLLAFAIKRNVERVERRYRNEETRALCQAFAAAADAVLEHVEEQRRFAIIVAFQPELWDYETDDEAYSIVE